MPPETLGSLLLRLARHQVFHHGPEAVVTRVDDLGRALGPTAVLPWPSLRILLRPHVFALSVFGIAVRLRADDQLCQDKRMVGARLDGLVILRKSPD